MTLAARASPCCTGRNSWRCSAWGKRAQPRGFDGKPIRGPRAAPGNADRLPYLEEFARTTVAAHKAKSRS